MPDKTDAVVNAPRPTDVTQLRAYPDLLNYYNRCLPNLSSVVWPLNQMSEKGRKWRWTEKCEKAFLETKRINNSDQVLTHYDPQLPIGRASLARENEAGGNWGQEVHLLHVNI